MKCSAVTSPKNAKRGSSCRLSRRRWRVMRPIIATSRVAIARRQNAISTAGNGFYPRTKKGVGEKKKKAENTENNPKLELLYGGGGEKYAVVFSRFPKK